MTASGFARRSDVSDGAGGGAAQVSSSVRYALAVGLLLVGIGNLAAIDFVLLPRYLAGATSMGSLPPPSLPMAATPTAIVPALSPPPSPPVADTGAAEIPALPPPANPPVVEAPARTVPTSSPPAEPPAAAAATADLAEHEFPHVLFARNTTWLSPEAREILARLAATLAENPGRRVVFGGHTDNVGPEDLNRALSLARARKSGHWLEGRGIDPERIEIQGFGSTRPVAGDRSPEAQARNRRVEIDLR